MQYNVVMAHKLFAPMMGITAEKVDNLLADFTKSVNEHIRQGWSPHGSVATYRDPSSIAFLQAMTKD